MQRTDRQILIFFVSLLVLLGLVIYGLFVYQERRYGDLAFDYNGFTIQKTPQGYRFQIHINQGTTPNYFTLRSDPRTLDDILVDRQILSLKEKKEIFAVIDPDANLTGVTTMAVLELDKILDNAFLFNIPVNAALTETVEGSGLEAKDCTAANATVGVVYFKLGETTRVFEEKDCFTIEGVTEDDLVRAADKVVLILLGIISSTGL